MRSPKPTTLINLSTCRRIGEPGNIVCLWSAGNQRDSSSILYLEFKYSMPNGTIGSSIQYVGGLQVVVHTLVGVRTGATVVGRPVTLGNADSVPIATDGYTLQSAAGRLSPLGFNGFAGHGGAGWELVNSSSTALSELNLANSTTLAPNGHTSLAVFVAGGPQDLVFNYSVVGHGVWNGDVIYQTELAGDANGDGIVDSIGFSNT